MPKGTPGAYTVKTQVRWRCASEGQWKRHSQEMIRVMHARCARETKPNTAGCPPPTLKLAQPGSHRFHVHPVYRNGDRLPEPAILNGGPPQPPRRRSQIPPAAMLAAAVPCQWAAPATQPIAPVPTRCVHLASRGSCCAIESSTSGGRATRSMYECMKVAAGRAGRMWCAEGVCTAPHRVAAAGAVVAGEVNSQLA